VGNHQFVLGVERDKEAVTRHLPRNEVLQFVTEMVEGMLEVTWPNHAETMFSPSWPTSWRHQIRWRRLV
jgi:hypothetical protein